eukprot:244143-Pleurochrysis_carterae.AAC.1
MARPQQRVQRTHAADEQRHTSAVRAALSRWSRDRAARDSRPLSSAKQAGETRRGMVIETQHATSMPICSDVRNKHLV